MKQKRIRDHGVVIGEYPTGPLNKISDVPGVLVGHATLDDERHKTGVSVILPGPENPFLRKPVAAAFVLNGFGKTLGLVQIQELGTIETPIALTNTLNVGRIHDAMVGYMIDRCQRDGVRLTSVNPVVCECNDAGLNDIQRRDLGPEHLLRAIDDARADFAEGDVGCGKGMVCHSLKGGVGSASRQLEIDGRLYTIGVLVQSNHGSLKDLNIAGRPAERLISGQRLHHQRDRHRHPSHRPPARAGDPPRQRGIGTARLLHRPRERRGHARLYHAQPHAARRRKRPAAPARPGRRPHRPAVPGRGRGRGGGRAQLHGHGKRGHRF